ncbi:Eukaryotic elongation factor 2 kinase [Symbiodinium microadriaticum]|uniref:Eukaryotic elongation factor 2 kinase n=1 Tax=Symbiodinium microadriaticum TaxID=2951 RepID=A0A1Q9CAA2_SYMMI|nr:Eukaryotic elongation factor 2 kinase [Symbiodinium microadriaticum]CAE7625107.1 Eef2k [Symbiodinium microadriaticum]CAE7753263.1 Eef2k [Symbiodinium sp. KB8]
MYLPAARHFEISEQTRSLLKHAASTASISSEKVVSEDGKKLKPSAVLEHAKEARRRIREMWSTFEVGERQIGTRRIFDIEQDDWQEERILVEIDAKSFGQGAIRECFRMKEVNMQERSVPPSPNPDPEVVSFGDISPSARSVGSDEGSESGFFLVANSLLEMRHSERRRLYVAKRSMQDFADLEQHRHDCSVDVMHQAMAKHYAELYNQSLRTKLQGDSGHFPHLIDFLLTHMIELEDGRTFGAEAFLFGNYIKHNNNSGGTMGAKKTPQTFSYFTFVKSGRSLMVVDIQGIDDIYTDPVIHFLPCHASGSFRKADSSVNLGIRGFALFLWSHRYNDVDRTLGLPVFALARSELETPVPEQGTCIRDLNAGVGVWDLTSRSGHGNSNVGSSDKVLLSSVPDLDLRASSWDLSFHRPKSSVALPLDLVEAACHMEIAAMYHEGRLSPNAASLRTRAELEAAIFHIAEAAKQGLPEALLALARLASDMDHSEFLPQVSSTEAERPLCLALLRTASNLGVLAAHGAVARLLVDGVYSDKTEEALLVAANCLEKYASDASETGTVLPEPLKHEVCCRHGCSFGWDAHGWEPHSAYARAAELYEHELRSRPGSWAKSRELWSLAAECALEDPRLAKQAMRYTEKAEQEELEEAQGSGIDACDESDGQGALVLRLQGDLQERFQKFAATFTSPEDALERLIQLAESAEAANTAAPYACKDLPTAPLKDAEESSAAPLKEAAVDEDVWALLG